jgi:hypothetical protein
VVGRLVDHLQSLLNRKKKAICQIVVNSLLLENDDNFEVTVRFSFVLLRRQITP